jgi:segregation and condensation protein B
MDLKAKLEAVIYAAEEPVTLAQLAALFADEALAWKAEQEAARAAASAEATESAPVLAGFEPASSDPGQTQSAAREAEGSFEIAFEIRGDTPAETSPENNSVTAPDADLADAGSDLDAESAAPASPDAEARRQARQRDREVRAILQPLLNQLMQSFASDGRGIEIREIAGGYRMSTKPACHDAVRAFIKSLKPALKLSLPALETLAVIAYKQPVTAPEVNEIRGVDSSGVFGSLLARKLIATAGRKQVIGRPILYKTTREFLLRFGLNEVSELPSMEEFEKMAVELEETNELDESSESETLAPEDTAPAIAADLDFELRLSAEDDSASAPHSAPKAKTAG